LCIKLVSIKELYYDARPTKSQDVVQWFRQAVYKEFLAQRICQLVQQWNSSLNATGDSSHCWGTVTSEQPQRSFSCACLMSWNYWAFINTHCLLFLFLIIKPTRCSNLSNLFLEWNCTCFGQFLCPSSGVSYYTCSNGICHTGLLTACEQDQDDPARKLISKPVWHIPLLHVQWKNSWWWTEEVSKTCRVSFQH